MPEGNKMESHSLNAIVNLLGYLVSLHIQRVSTPFNQAKIQDVLLLQHALTRFVGAENDMHDFKQESPELLAALNRHVAGQFSKEIGESWQPGSPMHLTHLVNALIHIVSKTQHGGSHETTSRISFGLISRGLELQRS